MGRKTHSGFTLIELLVVVAVIGILAAVAIPQFVQYQAQVFRARVESDVRTTVTALEAQYAQTESYGGALPVQSPGVTVTITATPDTITAVSGQHATCTKGTYRFDGATGQYAWQ
jgi:prepilin-type N-terminal cleavage/methylation domain-containing protein